MKLLKLCLLTLVLGLSACSTIAGGLNPFEEAPTQYQALGSANDSAIGGGGANDRVDSARQALDVMSTYRSSQGPQPNNPVVQPSVVRLMWIPDHLNSHGDLVPAHYYYLKVLSDRWAVQDAFELESQLGTKKEAASIPYVYEGQPPGQPQGPTR